MNSVPFKPAVTAFALSALLAIGACGKKVDDTVKPAPMSPPSTSPSTPPAGSSTPSGSGSSSGASGSSGTSSGSSGTAMPPTGAASGMGSDSTNPPAAAASK